MHTKKNQNKKQKPKVIKMVGSLFYPKYRYSEIFSSSGAENGCFYKSEQDHLLIL